MNEMIRGIYRNGVIEPVEPLKIAEGTEVYVTVPRKRSREELIELLLKLKEKGIVDFDPANLGKPFPPITPIKIKGGPMSDTIIEERFRIMYYMDGSALVKIYIDETGSEWAHAVRDRSESFIQPSSQFLPIHLQFFSRSRRPQGRKIFLG